MVAPLIVGGGALVFGAVIKTGMHVGALWRRTDAQSLIEKGQKEIAETQVQFNAGRAVLREEVTQKDRALEERFAPLIARYGTHLEEEEIVLPPEYAERTKTIPPPHMPHIMQQSVSETLEKVFSSGVTVTPTERMLAARATQHPYMAAMLGVKYGADLLQEGYADFKVAGEKHRAAQKFHKESEERCKTVMEALDAERQRIRDFYELIDSYKWLFTRVSFVHSPWERMWDRNRLAVLRAYGIYTDARTFNRITLEAL